MNIAANPRATDITQYKYDFLPQFFSSLHTCSSALEMFYSVLYEIQGAFANKIAKSRQKTGAPGNLFTLRARFVTVMNFAK